jgi:hypothetical protein
MLKKLRPQTYQKLWKKDSFWVAAAKWGEETERATPISIEVYGPFRIRYLLMQQATLPDPAQIKKLMKL